MDVVHSLIERPVPVCVDIISEFDREQYFPIDKKGNFLQTKFINFLIKRGYVFDFDSEKWYILMKDGLYYPVSEGMIRHEIITLARYNTPEELNITSNFITSIVVQLGGLSNLHTLSNKFNEYLEHTDLNYDIPESITKPGTYDGELIPVKNGIINTSNMELLPHCGYYFAPCPYGVEYFPIPEEDIFKCTPYKNYLKILGDHFTLYFYLWWAGMVLFAPRPAQMFLFLYGSGGTGKTTLADALSGLLGDLRVSKADLKLLSNPHGNSCLENKRLNVTYEVDKGHYDGLNTFLKSSGERTYNINPKYQDPRTIKNTVNLLFLGNTFMDCDLADGGIRRRIFVINCNNKMEWNDKLLDVLVDNNHLNWLFNAAYYVYSNNNDKDPHDLMSLSMKDALNDVLSINSFNAWIGEYCGSLDFDIVQDKLLGEVYSELYKEYISYVNEYESEPIPKKDFKERLRVDYRLKYSSRGGENVMVRL